MFGKVTLLVISVIPINGIPTRQTALHVALHEWSRVGSGPDVGVESGRVGFGSVVFFFPQLLPHAARNPSAALATADHGHYFDFGASLHQKVRGGRFSDGWGSCDRREKRFLKPNLDIPSTAKNSSRVKKKITGPEPDPILPRHSDANQLGTAHEGPHGGPFALLEFH
ncbi:hypothetical protein CRG98_046672 [Punica granatum]|uniref:Uncharacterized protein n=1 Tax=Punica granatum TaxID=22663 RepID=A0A2I0HMK4_PUNGR|nr:hypothetical protein CRG98_046672 [Punica granatum]